MADVLAVLVGEDVAGTVRRRTNNLLTFEYDPAYRARPDATPMSLSMPLAAAVHADTPARRTVTNYLAGLLPDDSDVVERWARYYSVRTSSPMFVLGTPVGRDCAGGVAFCPPGELSDFRARGGAVEWLTTGDVADLLRDLQRDRTAMLGRDFTGQFSLAGAQRKTALRREPGTGRWGRPSGTEPTTHILKPAISGWAEQDINEHLCLAAANRSGLTAARSSIECFDDQEAIVVARYDRIARPSGVIRVHQEDLCQGLGLGPDRKYESDGGPTAKGIAALLRRVMPPRDADAAVRTFADGLIWNWLVMGTDAHAKNYSVLLLGRDVRLAPFYDINSMLPYVGTRSPSSHEVVHERRQTFAMKLGGTRDVYPLRNPWPRVAADLGLPADALVERAAALVATAPGAFAAASAEPAIASLRSDVADRLVQRVAERAARCLAVIG